MRKKIAVIFGGRSVESDISVISAMQALFAIDKKRFIVEPIYLFEGEFFAKDVDDLKAFSNFSKREHKRLVLLNGEFFTLRMRRLKKYFHPDAALVCCHGGEGENGTLQAMLEFNNVPYTSAPVTASAIAMDKVATKRFLQALDIDMLDFEVVKAEEFEKDEDGALERLKRLSYPLIVKPASLGSSIGISAARDEEELKFALNVAKKFDKKMIVEHLLENCVEINCAAIRRGEEIIPSCTERPCASGSFLSFEDKYMSENAKTDSKHTIPAGVDWAEESVKAITKKIYSELEMRGVIRVDFLADEKKKRLYVNEINTVPGSLAFYLFEPMGMNFSNLLTTLVDEARCDDSNVFRLFKTQVLAHFQKGSKGSKYRPK